MRVGLTTCAYFEPRFIVPFLRHIPDWVDEKLVLVSTVPWQGIPETTKDTTARHAELNGGHVVQHDWPTEHAQRNAGQDWFYDMDWIITLDPDEYLVRADWDKLKGFLENATLDAYVCSKQFTYWKSGFVIDPPEDYKQIVAVRPHTRFVDKRVVNCEFGVAPVDVHHMSWARTNNEVLRKLAHYSHAHEINTEQWYNRVWKPWNPKMTDLHPLTPSALKQAIPTTLPAELEGLNLWP